mmetsp:Transcript_650/g.1392  ORF Transcript_650/g.1392 Transcript_650/m.1392 type:complete len:372 (+) Transcript_650:106-1221(+)
MPPHRDLDSGHIVGGFVASYRAVQKKYGDALVEEHTSKNGRVAALEAEARELAAAGMRKVEQVRSEGEALARATQMDGEAKVRRLEAQRLRLLEDHHRRMADIQAAIEAEREATDLQIQEVEEETQALFAAAEAQLLSISRNRDEAVAAARRRSEEAEERGESRIKQAEREEQEVLSLARATIKQDEERCLWQVKEAEKRCEKLLGMRENATLDLQKQVAKQLEELLAESTGSRRKVLENRSRADQHLELQVREKRDETLDMISSAQQALGRAKEERMQANKAADKAAAQTIRCCDAQRRDQIAEVHAAAEGVEQFIEGMPFRERSMNESLVEALAGLAARLKSGTFLEPPPRVQRFAAHDVEPKADTDVQ